MPAPSSAPLNIHMIAIGGSGMAPLACLLKGLGHRVGGSDGQLYPPMSTLLENAGIEACLGFRIENLEPPPDLVIVGNAVPRTNPEAREVERLGIPRISMPEALARFLLEKAQPLVVAGTHGKTTTTSLAAWVWADCNRDPSYLVGGVPNNFLQSFHHGSGRRFIIEGDEYNAAYFDRGPKFLHYLAETLLLTSVEYDHADLYPDPQSLIAAYSALVRSLPDEGLLVACGDAPEVRDVAREARCRVILYGLEESNELHPAGPVMHDSDGAHFTLADPQEGEITIDLPMSGEHNVSNALAVWAAARHDGIPGADIASALSRFRGVKRRMDELGTAAGVTVLDDFAHHPTAIGKTLEGLRSRYPDRRLIVAFEPRTLTAGRSFLANAYLEALSIADVALLAPIFHAERLDESERFDPITLVDRLRQEGVRAFYCEDGNLLERLVEIVQSGDVVVTMSSGLFDCLPQRLLKRLQPTGT